MKFFTKLFSSCLILLLAIFAACTPEKGNKGKLGEEKPLQEEPMSQITLDKLGKYTVSDPVKVKNLQVFFIYSYEVSKSLDKNYITLNEGCKDKVIEVSELKNAQVERLVVSNNSKMPLFIAAGELVKGGKQDRTMQVCMVVPAGEKYVPIPSFCIEASRWSNSKKALKFSSTISIAGNENMQAIAQKSQGKVWNSVAQSKKMLRFNAKKMANKAEGKSKTSSLNEELNDEDVKKLIEMYKKATTSGLRKIKKPVVGFAYAVNGKMVAMHMFSSSKLFYKMWDKYVVSMSIDAGSKKIDKSFKPAKINDVVKFTKKLRKGEKHVENFVPDNKSVRYLDKKNYTIEAFYKNTPVYIMLGTFDEDYNPAKK